MKRDLHMRIKYSGEASSFGGLSWQGYAKHVKRVLKWKETYIHEQRPKMKRDLHICVSNQAEKLPDFEAYLDRSMLNILVYQKRLTRKETYMRVPDKLEKLHDFEIDHHRDTQIWQKKSTHTSKETYIYEKRPTCVYLIRRGGFMILRPTITGAPQKKSTCTFKETCIYEKRPT